MFPAPHLVCWQLEFSSLEVAFDPIVPYTEGGRMEVTVFNKHPVPIEIFSLEFDRSVPESLWL